MRLIYIIGLLAVIGTGALWCGWYGQAQNCRHVGGCRYTCWRSTAVTGGFT